MNKVFEIIEPVGNPGRWARPQATMNVKGELKISRVAFEMLGEPECVLVSFDRASQTIALRKATRHDTKTHKLIAHGRHGEHGGRLIKVHGLLEHIDADLYTCMRFRAVRLDNNDRLLLEVANAVPAYHGKRIGVYNEWRMRHDEAYAAAQREAYARRKEAKAAAGPTEEEKEQQLIREDRAIREREYRATRKAEKAERREHEMAARAAERAKARARAAESAPPGMVEIDLGNGKTMLVTKQRAREIDQARLDYARLHPLEAYKARQVKKDNSDTDQKRDLPGKLHFSERRPRFGPEDDEFIFREDREIRTREALEKKQAEHQDPAEHVRLREGRSGTARPANG